MTDDGVTKDDVKLPDGEIGEKINKLFKIDEKDTSKSHYQLPRWPTISAMYDANSPAQTLLFLLPWVRRPPLRPRRLPASKCNLSISLAVA